jgi:hypothetical protein
MLRSRCYLVALPALLFFSLLFRVKPSSKRKRKQRARRDDGLSVAIHAKGLFFSGYCSHPFFCRRAATGIALRSFPFLQILLLFMAVFLLFSKAVGYVLWTSTVARAMWRRRCGGDVSHVFSVGLVDSLPVTVLLLTSFFFLPLLLTLFAFLRGRLAETTYRFTQYPVFFSLFVSG